jgi:hypothetical protein
MQGIIDLPTHFENEFVRIKYLPEKNYIEEVWKDFGEDEEIKFAKNKLINMLLYTDSKAYLSDLRGFKGASPENQYWVRDVWFPEAYNAGLRTIAFLVMEDIYANFTVETVITGEYAKKMTLHKFMTYEEADIWLKKLV